MPVLALGVTAVKLLLGAAGLVKMFSPFCPNLKDASVNNLDKLIEQDDSYIQKLKGENDSQGMKTVRGSYLREFSAFLIKKILI